MFGKMLRLGAGAVFDMLVGAPHAPADCGSGGGHIAAAVAVWHLLSGWLAFDVSRFCCLLGRSYFTLKLGLMFEACPEFDGAIAVITFFHLYGTNAFASGIAALPPVISFATKMNVQSALLRAI